jgi:hypothetical protein
MQWWLLLWAGRQVRILIHQSASIPALAPNAISRNTLRIPGAHSPWDIFRIRVLTFLVPDRLTGKAVHQGKGPPSVPHSQHLLRS